MKGQMKGQMKTEALPNKILLATVGSQDAALAARAAADISQRSGAELHLVHVWQDVPTAHFHGYVIHELKRRGEELLDEQVKKVEEAGYTVASTHLRSGNTVKEILSVAAEIDAGLMVVGSRGMGSLERIILGSVSTGLVHHTDRPVLVMRGGNETGATGAVKEAWPPKSIVIGDDGSEEADSAARVGAILAGRLGIDTILVRVRPRLPVPPEGGLALTERVLENAQQRAEADLLERAGELEALTGNQPRMRTFVGDAAYSILQTADEERGLIVVRTLDQNFVSLPGRVRLDGTAEKVLRTVRGPVLIVPRSIRVDQSHESATDDHLLVG